MPDGSDPPDGLDRVRAPDPTRPRPGDVRGKRALYSVDDEANPTTTLTVRCRRCGAERGLTLREVPRLFCRPWIPNPFNRTLWTRCPACEERSWLEVHLGSGIPWPFGGPPPR